MCLKIHSLEHLCIKANEVNQKLTLKYMLQLQYPWQDHTIILPPS